MCSKRKGQALRCPPKWQLRGIEGYEQFLDVFFLDTIERAVSGGDAADAAAVARFKCFQLSARAGTLTDKD